MINTQSKQLEERTLELAVSVIQFCKKLPKNQEYTELCKQLIRSASSIGANYTEANNASSRLDFKNKIYIAKKEASETRYWLRLLARLDHNLDTMELEKEVSQLILIFQKVVNTLRNGK